MVIKMMKVAIIDVEVVVVCPKVSMVYMKSELDEIS